MGTRRTILIILTLALCSAVGLSAKRALQSAQSPTTPIASLQNVRDYAPAATADGTNYAVDGGLLFAGKPGAWHQLPVPDGVIVGAVAVHAAADATDTGAAAMSTLYIGAANELALFRSTDAGHEWHKVSLSRDAVGGVTDLALDAAQNLLYVGTDTAGLFRVQETGSRLLVRTQIPLPGRVVDVATDSSGADLVFARTDWALYRAEQNGLNWMEVTGLDSTPTAVVVANSNPPAVYVGTEENGLLRSHDGRTWTPFNTGLQMGSSAQLRIDALAVDPAQPDVIYTATSQLWGSRERQTAPSEIAFITAGDSAWRVLPTEGLTAPVAALLPVSAHAGAAYALTTQSRAPLALGDAVDVTTAAAEAATANTEPMRDSDARQRATVLWSWITAGLAGMALLFSVGSDLYQRSAATRRSNTQRGTLRPQQTHESHGS